MKVKLQDGRKIYIEFRYDLDPPFDEHDEKRVIVGTQAYIEVDDFGGHTRRAYIGKAVVHPNEAPRRIVGRKIALRYALKNAHLKKEERIEVWRLLVSQGFKLF